MGSKKLDHDQIITEIIQIFRRLSPEQKFSFLHFVNLLSGEERIFVNSKTGEIVCNIEPFSEN